MECLPVLSYSEAIGWAGGMGLASYVLHQLSDFQLFQEGPGFCLFQVGHCTFFFDTRSILEAFEKQKIMFVLAHHNQFLMYLFKDPQRM